MWAICGSPGPGWPSRGNDAVPAMIIDTSERVRMAAPGWVMQGWTRRAARAFPDPARCRGVACPYDGRVQPLAMEGRDMTHDRHRRRVGGRRAVHRDRGETPRRRGVEVA